MMPGGFDQRVHGSRPRPSGRPALEDAEHARRARLEVALATMRSASNRRHAELDAVIAAIAPVIGVSAERMARLPWLRSELSALIHSLRQSA